MSVFALHSSVGFCTTLCCAVGFYIIVLASISFSSQGGTPLPCLETFIGDSPFSEVKIDNRLTMFNLISSGGESSREERSVGQQTQNSLIPELPQLWSEDHVPLVIH